MSQKAKARKKGRGKVIDKWKSKNWYEIYAPKSFSEEYLGTIPSGNEESLEGRVVETLLYNLTNNFKHTHIKLKFKIFETLGEKRCNTHFWGHELTRDFIRSLIHRGSTRIDGVFNYKTADGFTYRVSTFVVTRRRAKQSQKKTIRKIIFQVLNEFAKNMPHDKFIRGIIFGKFAMNIKKIAKTIYTLRECQIRKVKIVNIPEGAIEESLPDGEDEITEVELKLPEHGKTVKANMARRKKNREGEGSSEEVEEVPEAAAAEEE